MRLSIIQRIKVYILKLTFELLVFLDFLESAPINIIKFTIKMFGVFVLLFFFLGFLAVEARDHNIHNIIKYQLKSSHISSTYYVTNNSPKLVKDIPFPGISARSYIIVDLNTNTILKEYNSKTALPPASTTKMMTALVSRDLFTLDQTLRVPEKCTATDSQQVGFEVGEELTVFDLMNSLLISSAGDAACTLAYGSGDFQDFVNRMNRKALDNNMLSTNFSNPVGLDDFSDNHLSSAYDLYLLAKLLRQDSFLRSIVSTKDYNLTSGKIERKIFNTNDLLWDISGTVGIKTGRTYGAGEVLVYEYSQGDADILIIVMGSLDRFKDTKNMLNWVLDSYSFSYNK